jgi:hypothetical protein
MAGPGVSDIELIDQRIRRAQADEIKMGTCVSRDDAGPGAMILFSDGSTVAVPVKVFGQVVLNPGMRCGVVRFGTEWIVVGTFASPSLGYVNQFTFAPGAVPTVAGPTFIDITGFDPVTFTKLYDNTAIEIQHTCGGFADIGQTKLRWGIRFTQTRGNTPYTPIDYQTCYLDFSVANMHLSNTTVHPITLVPAGTYTVTTRWKRTGGTGTGSTSGDDIYSLTLREYVPPDNPFV